MFSMLSVCINILMEGVVPMEDNNISIVHILFELNEEISQVLSGLQDIWIDESMERIKEIAMEHVISDLIRFMEEDPSLHNVEKVAWESNGFKAVRYYRYLNSIYRVFQNYKEKSLDEPNDIKDLEDFIMEYIQKQSETVKNNTKVEIHPMANIGKGFIIDHGTGTVIGERVTIGDNCTILNDVILGSAFNPSIPAEDRHPTLKNGIIICSGVRILGNIEIGNNCKIGTKCIIKRSIPDNTVVSLVNQLQISRTLTKERVIIFGIIPQANNIILLYGRNLPCSDSLKVEILSECYVPINEVNIRILEKSNDLITIKISTSISLKNKMIRIFDDVNEFIIQECMALSEMGGFV